MMPINGLPRSRRPRCPPPSATAPTTDKQAYKAALGFEQMLLGQLVKAMLPKAARSAEGPYARADAGRASPTALVADGGLGLAAAALSIQEGCAS